MRITITQEFDTPDEAAAFLARLAPPAITISLNDHQALGDNRPGDVVLTDAKPARKPRSDAGQPRGAYRRRGQNAEGAQGGTQPPDAAEASANGGPGPDTPAPSAPANPPAPAPDGAGIAEPTQAPVSAAGGSQFPATEEGARAALKALNEVPGKGMDACLATLRNFGINRVSELKEGQHADFIKRVVEQLPR